MGFRKYKTCFINFFFVPLVIFIITYFAFPKFTKLGFIIDDIDYLMHLVISRSDSLSFIHSYALRGLSFKPMSLGLNWVINFYLFGTNPHNYYLFNIAVHAINSFLVYLLLNLIFKFRMLSFMVSLYYLMHPFNLEGLSWISAGFTSQNVVFFSCLTLITYYLYIKGAKKIFIVLSYLLYFCAFLSREDVILLPVLIIILLIFIRRLARTRILEVSVYAGIALLVLLGRFLFLYPNPFQLYRWDFLNIQNALLRNEYYLNLAFGPFIKLFSGPAFLENNIILSIILKLSLFLFLAVFVGRKIYTHWNSDEFDEAKLLVFGLIWYLVLAVPFNFMIGAEFWQKRYLSLSIVGILIAQIAAIAIVCKPILKSMFYASKFLFLCFSSSLILISHYMIIAGFSESIISKHVLNYQYYAEKIHLALKRNPGIQNIQLVGFPGEERASQFFKFFPEFKNIEFTVIENLEDDSDDREADLTIEHREI